MDRLLELALLEHTAAAEVLLEEGWTSVVEYLVTMVLRRDRALKLLGL